ncbi:LysR substrate-binding domain-containing protein [Cupriavidus basilensis]|uniref:LysR substrate-binding domain-containing protein n=1 Tax=Cupriavidus basilensis TaxID=68895 RepID=A0ABT6AW45_9BURK|nr:LysR substrate-binding domain-containing protein [Cupriavidus basilensis]MDF3836694.1 LysR substrate-binding domain-containing protein [Cupriavidus basilensis]
MNFRQLQCLCAVADADFNLSRAASALNVTQPAISKQLRQLSDELGTDLLLRQSGRPVALTEEGKQALAWGRQVLQCMENIRVVTGKGASEARSTIFLATSHTHASYLLLPAIVAFSCSFPSVQINVQLGTPNQVADLVRDGKATVGVTHLPEELPTEVVAAQFLSSPRLLILPPGHALLKERDLTLEKLARYPLILQYSSRALGPRILRKFQQAELQVDVAVEALDADVIKNFVEAELGLGIIPAFAYSPAKDHQLRARNVGHLFDASESAVLLRRHSQLPKHVYQFLEVLDPALKPLRVEPMVLEGI